MNGRDCGCLWTPPYRVEVMAALVAGENRLEIQVANRWMNRVIGDEHLPVDGEWGSPWGGGPTLLMKGMPDWFVQGRCPPSGRIAFSTARPWTKASPLAPAVPPAAQSGVASGRGELGMEVALESEAAEHVPVAADDLADLSECAEFHRCAVLGDEAEPEQVEVVKK